MTCGLNNAWLHKIQMSVGLKMLQMNRQFLQHLHCLGQRGITKD